MFRREIFFMLLSPLLILGACVQNPVEPEPLDFDSDPRILRGTWVGEDENGDSLLLYLKSSSPTADGYEIAGFFQLFGGIAVNITGSVRTPVTQTNTLDIQTSPVCPDSTYATSQDGAWELCGDAPMGSPPQFNITLIDQSAQGEVRNFSLKKKAGEISDPNLLVHGEVVYVQGEPYTHPEPFEFTEDSHAIVQLWYSWSALGDAPGELVAETTLEDISSLPIAYRLLGDAEAIFARQGDYYLNIGVFSGSGGVSGEEFAVGDLTNEFYTPVPNPGAEIEVEVTSLEACGSPNSGGFCTTTNCTPTSLGF